MVRPPAPACQTLAGPPVDLHPALATWALPRSPWARRPCKSATSCSSPRSCCSAARPTLKSVGGLAGACAPIIGPTPPVTPGRRVRRIRRNRRSHSRSVAMRTSKLARSAIRAPRIPKISGSRKRRARLGARATPNTAATAYPTGPRPAMTQDLHGRLLGPSAVLRRRRGQWFRGMRRRTCQQQRLLSREALQRRLHGLGPALQRHGLPVPGEPRFVPGRLHARLR